MADTEMTDAPPAAAPAKAKASKAGADSAADGKKRFEVKKVSDESPGYLGGNLRLGSTTKPCLIVECRRAMGVGYCRR